MTAFLASVRSLREAETALVAGADIIDLKEPANGAMGAVSAATARQVLAGLDGRVDISATVGDPGGDPAKLRRTVRAFDVAGVDIIKIPVVPEAPGDALALIANRARQGMRIVAVLICDTGIALDVVPALIASGVSGVMIDTLIKTGGSVVARHGLAGIGEFVDRVRSGGRLAGIAGGLELADIAGLLGLEPDLLGFRGALCGGHRAGAIDVDASLRIRAAIPPTDNIWQLRGGYHHGLETRA